MFSCARDMGGKASTGAAWDSEEVLILALCAHGVHLKPPQSRKDGLLCLWESAVYPM